MFIAASVLVSGIFLIIALNGVPFAEVMDGIRQAQIGWVILGFGGVWLAAAARAVRWRILIGEKLSFLAFYHSNNMTNFLNLLPLRAGEVGRTLALSTRYGVPLVTAATSVIVERLIDLVMIIVMLALGLAGIPDVPPAVAQTSLLFGVIAVIGLLVLIGFARFPSAAHRLFTTLEARVPLLRRIGLLARLEEMLNGLAILTDLRRLLLTLIWSVIAWSASSLVVFPLILALNIFPPGGEAFTLAVLTVSLVSFSIAIPVSIASLGPWEGAVRLAGDLLGADATQATTLGFLFHGVSALGYVFFGVISLLAMGITLGDILSARSPQPTAASPEQG